MAQSVLQKVNDKILNTSDLDKVWSYSDFQDLPFISVSKALSTLTQQGKIKRATKGFYYRPQKTILGEVEPNFLNLVYIKLNKKSAFFCVSGLSGFNNIGLTTQVPNITTIACDVPMLNTKNVRFILRKKPHSGSGLERVVLDALIDIDSIPGTVPEKAILKIKKFITQGKININDLGHSALHEPPRVRALVGALGQELFMDNDLINNLKKSLNPSSSYFIDVINVLEYSHYWNIKKK